MKRVRMDSLSSGAKFTCALGDHYTYDRIDGVSIGVHHVIAKDGSRTSFAGCADVTLGWNDLGWFATEARAS